MDDLYLSICHNDPHGKLQIPIVGTFL